ncbi:hypothetical protein CRENBAI_017518 [Crenichthys baileyi]|uniref:Uncharacterized protein n=1 Tax=Crenichthys baileyi TaxID=28760 RepID=A0AAV9QT69_9TELE
MPDTVWMARLRSFATTGSWPADEGNRPAPRQKKWYELYQRIEKCPMMQHGQKSLFGGVRRCLCGFHIQKVLPTLLPTLLLHSRRPLQVLPMLLQVLPALLLHGRRPLQVLPTLLQVLPTLLLHGRRPLQVLPTLLLHGRRPLQVLPTLLLHGRRPLQVLPTLLHWDKSRELKATNGNHH